MEIINNNLNNVIIEVKKGSLADELGIEPGDLLKKINNQPVKDIIDYKYLVADENITLEIIKQNGDIWEFEVEKDFSEDLGIFFSNSLIDKAKSCQNKCIFCFIDQLPLNLRETLYFKDDDSRLSFLQGNYITLTNMNEDEIDRIIKYRLSPINISVHTTNPDLRVRMLKNKRARNIMDVLKNYQMLK
jgi:Fe-S oxidoreductase, related to NifB/MoaA family